MPKMKSNSGAKKRFKVTKNGRVKFKGAYRNHILTKKSKKAKRKMRGVHYICDTQEHQVKAMLPYA